MSGRIELEVRKALVAAQGNRTLAQKELIRAVLTDDDLLRELVAPFLKPIAAQAIDRALRPAAPPPSRTPSAGAEPAAKPMSSQAKAAAATLGAGYNPMKAEKNEIPDLPRRPNASSRHVSTLRLLAAAYQVKRGERV